MVSEKLNSDFELFRDHCVIIKRDFNTYNSLFFSGHDGLLIKTASTFFNDLAEILQRDWILQVCKLMDPSSTNRKGQMLENISIELINSQLEEHKLLSSEILSVTEELKKYGTKITPARNKRIAHFDREHHVKNVVLGETSEQELDGFLVNIQKYCDLVGVSIGNGPLDFSSSGCPGDVHDLLKILSRSYEENA